MKHKSNDKSKHKPNDKSKHKSNDKLKHKSKDKLLKKAVRTFREDMLPRLQKYETQQVILG